MKSNAWRNQLLLHLFNNAAVDDVGDASGLPAASTAGSLYVALHTADPTGAGAQNASEANYTGYARVAVARSGGGWTVSGNSAENAAEVAFGECSAGSSACTHFSIGKESAGATEILYSEELDDPLAVSVGITPRFAAGDLVVTES